VEYLNSFKWHFQTNEMSKARRPEDCTLYVASPYGFSEAGRDFYYGKFLPTIKKHGFQILDPWKLTPQELISPVLRMPLGQERQMAHRAVNFQIGGNNEAAIRKCNGIVAVLDGSEVDGGVASEIGFGYGLRKAVLGYRNDFRLASENIGAEVNIQVEHFIIRSGGLIAKSLDEFDRLLIPTFVQV